MFRTGGAMGGSLHAAKSVFHVTNSLFATDGNWPTKINSNDEFRFEKIDFGFFDDAEFKFFVLEMLSKFSQHPKIFVKFFFNMNPAQSEFQTLLPEWQER